MSNPPSKTEIRSAFNRAAQHYDLAAEAQRFICHRLLADLPPIGPEERILDAGCGTGYGLKLLHQRNPLAKLVAIDVAPAMLEKVDTECVAAVGDIEKLPFANGTLSGWWSSLTIQWCDAEPTLQEAARTLRQGGWLALASLGPSTFHELRTAFAGIDEHQHTLRFFPKAYYQRLVENLGFSASVVRTDAITFYYPDLKSLLFAVKGVGANRLGSGRRPGMMGKSAWRAMESAYEGLRTSQGLPLSYEVIYCHATL